jgi:hypothetical protein
VEIPIKWGADNETVGLRSWRDGARRGRFDSGTRRLRGDPIKDGHCQAWMDSKMGPWSPGSKYLAVGLKNWDAAQMRGKWAMKHYRCKGWW